MPFCGSKGYHLQKWTSDKHGFLPGTRRSKIGRAKTERRHTPGTGQMMYLKIIIDTGSDMDSVKEWHLNQEGQLLQHPVHLKDFSLQ